MHFEGKVQIKAPRDKVFNFLLNPVSVAKCLPSLQKVEVKSPESFSATVRVGVGSVKGDLRFNFDVTGKEPPRKAGLAANGNGMGSRIDLEAAMELTEAVGGVTELSWQAEAKISGLIANLGQRLVTAAAERIVSDMFGSMKTELESRSA